jgi:hypothetical protein
MYLIECGNYNGIQKQKQYSSYMNDEESKTHVKVCINQFDLFAMGLVWKRQSKPEGFKHCALETENLTQ